MHESFDRKHEAAESSERGFGLVFAGVGAIVAAYQMWHGDGAAAAWWLGGAAAFAALALFWTAPLVPLNRLWGRLGKLLHDLVNPLLMGLIFALAVIPMGMVLRVLGKDLLRLRRDASAATYWIDRDPAAARADAMKDQF
jgi:hypothetical protein